jgi:hypothetical protein
MKIKISPSLLQEFADTQNGKFEGTKYEKTNETFIDYLMGDYEPNIHTSRGTAWHAILEEGASAQSVLINPEGLPPGQYFKKHEEEMGVDWYFGADLIAFAKRWEAATDLMTYELRNCLELKTPGFEVYILMKCDALNIGTLHEFKTSQSNKGWSDFLDSLQWRLYLMAYPDVEFVMYHIFKMPRIKPEAFPVDLSKAGKNPPNVINKMVYTYFSYRRYEGLEADVKNRIESLTNWLKGQDEKVKKRLEADLDKIEKYLSFV